MLDTSARLLRVLALLQAQRDWTGDALAARLDITPRTVRRDVDRLRRLGYSVDALAGRGGGYRLGTGATLPPLLLDDDEAVAVAVGLRTAAGGSVAGIEESSARALVKLDQVLPHHLRRRVGALQAFTVPVGGPQITVEADALATLAAACRDSEQLRFDYRAFDGTTSRRTVDPVRLVSTGRRWYLLCWDRDRDDWRTLRVDRIDSTLVVGPRVPRLEPPGDVAAFVAQAVGAAAYQHRVRVRVAAPAAVIGDRIPPTSGWVEAIDDRSCLLVTGADSIDRMAGFLATLDHDFDVEEPAELRDALERVAARLTRASGRKRGLVVGTGPAALGMVGHMGFWVLKSEPESFGYADLVRVRREGWDGVRSFQARNHMREMAKGDLALFYHSNATPPGVAGIAKIVKTAEPDPSQFEPTSKYYDPKSDRDDPKWDWVTVAPVRALEFVSLDEMKQMPELANSRLTAKGNRLSVFPLTEDEFHAIVAAADAKKKRARAKR